MDTAANLLAIMHTLREAIRAMGDSANHRALGCLNGSGFGPEHMTCSCAVGRRHVEAWRAFHAVLDASPAGAADES